MRTSVSSFLHPAISMDTFQKALQMLFFLFLKTGLVAVHGQQTPECTHRPLKGQLCIVALKMHMDLWK